MHYLSLAEGLIDNMRKDYLLSIRFTIPVLLLLAFSLLFMLPGGGLLHAQTATIEYAENGTGPVATLTATDPEGVTPIIWSLAIALQVSGNDDLDEDDNADADDFMIDDKDGMLKFKILEANEGTSPGSPDFENGQGSGTGNNTYKVVVAACDVTADDCRGGQTGYHKVTVKVTDVAEAGKVTWTTASDGTTADDTTLMQFHVGTLLTARATDGDISGDAKAITSPIWRWYRGSSAIIDEETNAYTVTTADVGSRIRAMATYVVAGNVGQEMASLTSDYPVLAVRAGANKLEFDPTTVSREVAEGKKGMMVGAPVTATGNHGAVNYTLEGDDAAKFEIDKKTGQITTDVDLNYDMADADNCRDADFCTVMVRATDASGSATAASAATNVFVDATVTIKVTDVNEKPMFSAGDQTVSVAEGSVEVRADSDGDGDNDSNDGANTYMAIDPESRGITYHLMGSDRNKFQLNASRDLSFQAKPDYEMPADANGDNVYEVTVRASDGTLNEDRMVMVMVSNVDDAPAVSGPSSVNFVENGTGPVATLTATDPEGVTPIIWSLAIALQVSGNDDLDEDDNADADDFMIDDKDGMLKFKILEANEGTSPGSPDFENGQGSGTGNNTYKVVVAACDVTADDCRGGQTGYHKVTVKVTDVAEAGKVTWTTASDGTTADDTTLMQFHVGTLLTARATDGDISGDAKAITSPTWRWYRGSSAIIDEETNAYTVTTADVGSRIRVVATYRVGGSTSQEMASLTSDYPVLAVRAGANKLEFDPTTVSREVAEGKKGMMVGAPVTATGNHGAVNYTLEGDDAAKFEIDKKTGQITTDVDLNYDMADADNCRDADFCTVMVRATDASGSATAASAATNVFVDATVTIKITDVNEKPMFSAGPTTITRAEDMTALADSGNDVTYTAVDLEGLNVNLTLMGPDAAKFSLSSGGVLSFKAKPDYEMPADANGDNVYEVTVRASDGTLNEDRMVKVTVMNVDEAPVISAGPSIRGRSNISYPEDGTEDVATYEAEGLEAGASVRWSLSGADAGEFNIRGGVLTFASPPDFEDPADTNSDNVYMVTVRAGAATLAVAVTVTDEDDTIVGDTLLDRYDGDDSGHIDLGEAVDAVLDYHSGNLSLSDAVDVILLYHDGAQ